MDPSILLIIVFVVVVLGVLGILSSTQKGARARRFASKHPEAIGVFYSGPANGKVVFSAFEIGSGMDCMFKDDVPGLIVLPGPIRVKVSYSNSENVERTSFTQTLQFTAVQGKEYLLDIDESFKVMRVIPK